MRWVRRWPWICRGRLDLVPHQNAHWLQLHPGCLRLPGLLPRVCHRPWRWWLVGRGWGRAFAPRSWLFTRFGTRPLVYLGLMLAMGLFCFMGGYLGIWGPSRLLPTALTGQLIVFETLSALSLRLCIEAVGQHNPQQWDLFVGRGVFQVYARFNRPVSGTCG